MPAGARRRWLCRLCVPRPGASRSPRTGGRGLLCAEAPTGTFGILGIRRSARSCHSLCFPRPETPALGAAVGNPAAGKAAGEAVPARRLWGPLPAPAPGIHGALLACRPRAPAPASPDGSPVAEGLPRPHTLLQNVPHSAWCPRPPSLRMQGGGTGQQPGGWGGGRVVTQVGSPAHPHEGRGHATGGERAANRARNRQTGGVWGLAPGWTGTTHARGRGGGAANRPGRATQADPEPTPVTFTAIKRL